MKNFCTITTFSHLFKTFALADSLAKFGCELKVLLVDNENQKVENKPNNVEFFYLKMLHEEIALKIKKKYAPASDELRWSLKPVFLNHLLKDFKKVVYVDNDIYFYNSADFIFEELDAHDILLTPHHYPIDPENNQNWFEANFRRGLYNAGFFACNDKAVKALDWWAKCCLYRCEDNVWRGLFVDQKYLDIMPLKHENTKVLRHRGCNVAEWNKTQNQREYKNNDVMINGSFPIIFYHYNELSIREICEDENHILGTYFNQYFENLNLYKANLNKQDLYKKNKVKERIQVAFWKTLHKFNLS